ncbi:hypothetical protein [Qipengyuania nanhaisediminis]|uniref:hypothetical protein n=1 Tax=Qipengyuania nanhaisediminis TaxID=604088 RepID=UPI0038B366B2
MPIRILAALAALFLAACNPMAQVDGAGEQIARFHADYNKGDAVALYDRTAPEFREVTTGEDMQALVETIAARLGKVESSDRDGINISSDNGQTITVITMASQFEQGEATETFTFLGTGDDMALAGWNVDSPVFAQDLPAETTNEADLANEPEAALAE